ncbi:MAG TPA: RHS repeat-associated core domain-containing protein [Opitutaceae bacterium]|nr:RHS repeat-associated core domain-containing protein [Opitutaceae bacterium]
MSASRKLTFGGRPSLGIRLISAILIPTQLLATVPLQAVAVSSGSVPLSPPANEFPSRPDPALLAPRPKSVPHAPTVPKLTPPSRIFSADASSDRAIMSAHLFEEPLVPQTADPDPAENRALAEALSTYSRNPTETTPLESFLRQRPDSRWRASLEFNLGLDHFHQAEWSQALESWETAWTLTRESKAPRVQTVANRTLSELSQLHARLGHMDRLQALFQETAGRDVNGAASEGVAGARAGLWLMTNEPGEAFRCGPLAVSRLFQVLHPGTPVPDVVGNMKSTQQGTNLAALADLAKQAGLDYQLAFRSPGAAVPIPSVVNWKVGHFAALSRMIDGKYLAQDPTFGTDTLVASATLDAEASGYFLIPAGALPAGWRAVQPEEAKKVFGKGNAGPNGKPPPPPYAVTGHGNPRPPGGDPNGEGGGGAPCGMATYDLELASICLTLADNPVGYTPPAGPAIKFIARYNQRESASMTNISNLGNKWSFGWLSYIQAPSTSATVSYGPGGGQLSYSGYNSGTGAFDPQQMSQDRLVRISSTHYELTHSDGSVDVYDLAEGGANPRIFRTSFVDPAGNTVTYGYDSDFRLCTVTDAIGQVTVLDYGLSTNSATPEYYHVTKVTDPFGRYATLTYNSAGQLTSITDVIGLVSQFHYAAKDDFIGALTTPYGTTNFFYLDGTPTGSPTLELVLDAIDPAGGWERAFWIRDTSSLPGYSGLATESVAPTGFTNNFLQYRNTFYWDKKATLAGVTNYNNARVTHWLHLTPSDTTLGSSIIESTKAPLENRVWYAYPNQSSGSTLPGTSNQPSKIARILDDSSEQDFLYEYNAAGRMTKATDPLGRETDYVYDTNLIDLLQVKQKRGAGYDTLATYTYNSDHVPLTITDAAGQVTTNTYNAAGQLLTTTNPKSEVVTNAYDGDGYLQTVTGPVSGSTTTFTYDGFGRPETVTDSEGYTVTMDYDDFDRPTQVTYPDGTNRQMVYNRLDLEWSSDRLGRWSRQMHDAVRHVVMSQDELQRKTFFEWCQCGSLAAMTDPAGHRTSWARDVQSRLTQKTYPDSTSVSFAYETATSRLKSSTDARGQVTNYQYFGDNSLDQVSYTSAVIATPTVSYTYDTDYPRVATMTDGVGTTTYAYNTITGTPPLGAGQLASIDGPFANDTISYTYDELGRVTGQSIDSTSNPSSVVYDSLGRVTSVTNLLGTFTYGYLNHTSRLSSVSYPNGQVTNYTYYPNSAGTPGNDDQRLEQIENLKPDTSNLSTFGYAYDAKGLITSWSRKYDAGSVLTSSFIYDSSGQLTNASVPGSSTTVNYAYGYDGAGNRTEEQIDAGVITSAYNSNNQLTGQSAGGMMGFTGTVSEPATVTLAGNLASVDATGVWNGRAAVTVGANTIAVVATDLNSNVTNKTIGVTVPSGSSHTLTYDDNGNLTDDDHGKTYDWDAADRLVKITQGMDVTEFVYDGLGHRVQEKFNSTLIKQWVWAGGAQPAEERDGSNVVTKRFYAGGEQIGGTSYYFTRDHLGSVREITDGSGVVQARYDYDPYGRSTKISGSLETDFGYTGFFRHAQSGLWLTCYRSYDPELGRWLSRDPIGENGGINRYSYVGGNPVNFIDPMGLVKWGDLGSAGLGLITNGLGVATGVALAFVPEPTLLTKAAAVAVIGKSSYGFGASIQNAWAAINDKVAPSQGSLANDTAQLIAPGNQNAQRVASVLDLGSDLLGGRIGANAAKNLIGQVVRDARGFPLYNMEYLSVHDPGNLGKLADGFTISSVIQSAYSGFGSDLMSLFSHFGCPHK